ncbi:MAG: tandem-95 repeat protein, partial [Planctomycetales bacterium]
TVGVTAFASDADATTNGVTYSLDDDATGQFAIDGSSGLVTVAGAIDREAGATRTITVRATSDDASFSTKDFTIAINDLDEFDISAISDADATLDNVDENATVGTTVGVTAFASDGDATTDGVTYSLDDDSTGQFAINGSSGLVTVAGAIDREAGATRTITVRATSDDGSFSTKDFTIAINDLNDNAPIISVGQTFEVSEFASNGDGVGTATATDVDTVGVIQNWAITSGDVDGVFEVDAASGEIRVADNSLLNFETTATYVLSLRVEDGANTSSTQTVTVNVVDENDVPVLNVNAGIPVVEGGDVIISSAELEVSDEDELPSDIRYTVVDSPSASRLELTSDPGVSIATFTQADIDNNLLRFVHDGSEADDSFTFSISDGSGGTIGTTLFSISNLRVNDAPVNSTPASQTTNEDTPLVFSSGAGNGISVSDVDLNGGLIGIRLVATNGTLTLASTSGLVFASGNGSNDSDLVFAGLIDDVNDALKGLKFAPNANYNGPATVRVITRDMGSSGSGGEQIDDDTINITVTAVNDNPVAADDEYSTSEDNALTVTVASGLLSNDSDIDGDALTVVAVSVTTNGALSLNGDGSFVYTPNANFNGVDSFTYHATDGSLQSETRTVTLNVSAVNDASVSVDDEFTIDQMTVLELSAANGVLVNDLDVEADALQAVLVDGPQHGRLVLNADGSLTYTPTATFFGEDTFTYRSVDGSDDGSIGTVRIVVRQTVTSGGDGDVVIVEESDTTDGDETNDSGESDNGTGVSGDDAVDGSVDSDPGETSTTPTIVSPTDTSGETTDTTRNVNNNDDDGQSTNGSENEQPTFVAAFRVDERGELRDRVTGRIVEDAGVVVFTSTDVGSMVYVLEQTGFWTELDTFEQDVQASILQEGEWEELVVETTTVAGTTLTVGYIVWLLRSGSIVFGLVSSLPAWTMMDPLPVLQSGLEGVGDTDNFDDDSLQGILQAHHDGTESPAESFEE